MFNNLKNKTNEERDIFLHVDADSGVALRWWWRGWRNPAEERYVRYEIDNGETERHFMFIIFQYLM